MEKSCLSLFPVPEADRAACWGPKARVPSGRPWISGSLSVPRESEPLVDRDWVASTFVSSKSSTRLAHNGC